MAVASVVGTVADAARERVFQLCTRPTGLAHLDPTATAATIRRAISLGLSYLAKCQRRDGAWLDFLLYPGSSVEWITAHVAFVLENVTAARTMTARAAQYLASVGREDRGWGYCRRVANDCDSTAQALMVLHAHGIEPPRFIVDWLLAAQAPSGGFPTYPAHGGRPTNGWQREHADVTLMAVEAMGRLGIEPAHRERAVSWLSSTTEPLVHSYWWPSPAYAAWLQTRVNHRAVDASRQALSQLQQAHSTPHLAMLLAAARATRQGATANASLTTLIAQQLSDGSWPCAAVLRVTDPRDGDDVAGPVFAGTRRALSTAHAVAALESQRAREQ